MDEFEIINMVDALARSRNIDRKIVITALEEAMTAASKKSHLSIPEMDIHILEEDGQAIIISRRTVVDAEDLEFPGLQITLEDALEIYDEVEIGDELELEISPSIFGRNAAQIAKQVVMQKIQEAERQIILDEYRGRIGEILSGSIKREAKGNIIVDLGRTEAVLPYRERIPGENYRIGDRVRALLLKVDDSNKGPQLILTRAHPDFLGRLFELEVPEIYEEIVIIHNVSRDAGVRSKIGVSSRDKNIDPVGTCVGMRGYRVQAIVRELSGEKVDIVRYSENIDEYARNALAPAQITGIEIDHDNKELIVIVHENQLSLTIGKNGQNVRLAARLIEWKLDVLSETEREERRIAEEEEEEKAIEFFKSVEGVDLNIAIALFEEGFSDAEDIMSVDIDELCELEGVDEGIANRLYDRAEEYMVELANIAETQKEDKVEAAKKDEAEDVTEKAEEIAEEDATEKNEEVAEEDAQESSETTDVIEVDATEKDEVEDATEKNEEVAEEDAQESSETTDVIEVGAEVEAEVEAEAEVEVEAETDADEKDKGQNPTDEIAETDGVDKPVDNEEKDE